MHKLSPVLFILILLPISAALADPKVYSPRVEKGELAFEIRGNTIVDDDSSLDGGYSHVAELEYGVTDWWQTALVSRMSDPANGTFRYDSTAWENIVELTEGRDLWLDAGLYLEYAVADEPGVADKIETKLLLEKKLSRFVHTLNLIFEKEVGEYREESVEFGYAWRTQWLLNDDISIGFEAFGETGEIQNTPSLEKQEHLIGPVFYHEVHLGDLKLDYNLAWLAGLTDASPDHTLRWQLEFEF